MNRQKRILIFGGAGFVGKNLVKSLLGKGEKVVVVDNFFSSDREEFLELFKRPLTTGEVELKEIDITDTRVKLHIGGPYKAVVNLACPASPKYYERDFMYTVEINLKGTKRALDTAIYHGCPMIQASTSEIYGDPEIPVQSESYMGNLSTQGIRTCYAEGKRLAESICWLYRSRYGVDARIVRIFNAFGPYMKIDDGRVIPEFITRTLQKQPSFEYGESSRSFMYIDDLVNGLERSIYADRWLADGPVNLGDARNHYSTSELYDMVWYMVRGKDSRRWSREIDLVTSDRTEGDPKDRCPDITKARTFLNWEPCCNFLEGLQATVEYFRQKIQKSS